MENDNLKTALTIGEVFAEAKITARMMRDVIEKMRNCTLLRLRDDGYTDQLSTLRTMYFFSQDLMDLFGSAEAEKYLEQRVDLTNKNYKHEN